MQHLLTAKSRPKKDDLLLTKDGTLGRLALVDDRTVCINQSVALVRPNSKVVPKFLKVLLEAPNYQERMLQDAGGSTIKHIYITIVNRMPVAVPPTRGEQQAIAEALSDADALIEALDQLIAKKRQIKQGAMQELLTGKRRLPGFGGEWEVKRLGDIAEIVMGQSPSSAHYNRSGAGLPLIQGNADIENRKTIRRVFTTHVSKYGRCGDVLLSVRAPVGEVSIAVFDVCLGRGVCAVRYSNSFLYHALIAKEPVWAKLSKGSTFDSVNSTDVRSFEIAMPHEVAEQTAIATILGDMDTELAALESRLAKARQIKQGMMRELLTGRIRLLSKQ
jgi:type I restriction enzyme S subunit